MWRLLPTECCNESVQLPVFLTDDALVTVLKCCCGCAAAVCHRQQLAVLAWSELGHLRLRARLAARELYADSKITNVCGKLQVLYVISLNVRLQYFQIYSITDTIA